MHIKKMIKSLTNAVNKHRNMVTESIVKDESETVFIDVLSKKFRPLITEYVLKD